MLVRFCCNISFSPAFDLTTAIALWLSKITQAGRSIIKSMQVGEVSDERSAGLPAEGLRGAKQFGLRDLVGRDALTYLRATDTGADVASADYQAVATLHQIKLRPDDRFVITKQNRFWRRRINGR